MALKSFKLINQRKKKQKKTKYWSMSNLMWKIRRSMKRYWILKKDENISDFIVRTEWKWNLPNTNYLNKFNTEIGSKWNLIIKH